MTQQLQDMTAALRAFAPEVVIGAFAELMGCEFWTADRRFHRAVKDTLPYVRQI